MSDSELKNAVHEEATAEEALKDRRGFVAWMKAHKNQLILVGISIPTVIAIALGIKNKDSIIALWEDLSEEIKKAKVYSAQWFETATDEVLNEEREKVRLAYCASGGNISEAISLQYLLRRFDDEMSKRAWGDKTPRAPSIHREHGWYLPNDD